MTYQGCLYAPWYQDCFSWVDNVLTDAGEPKNTSLVRISEGAVGIWGGIVMLVAGVALWAKLSSKK